MRRPVARPAPNELEHEAVHLLEDRRILHAQRRELVDVEEAPVVDLLGRDAPVREAVRLLVEQPVEPSKLRGWPATPLKRRHAGLDQRTRPSGLARPARQAAA